MSNIIKTVSVEIGNHDFDFSVDRDDYDRLVNSITATNKTAPFHNFLIQSVHKDQKEMLGDLLRDSPSLEIELGSELMEQCKHKHKFSIKKPKNIASTSKEVATSN